MGWKETNRVELREEFVELVRMEGLGVSELCRRFGISRKTGYKWLARAAQATGPGECWAMDRSRRPHGSPWRTPAEVEQHVLGLRRAHPAWGGRKLARRLQDLGHRDVPSPSTITEILRRHGQLRREESLKRGPVQRFERAEPNDLWQMDFKGPVRTEDGRRCHPLMVVDDCSRYLVLGRVLPDERGPGVRLALSEAFRTHGLPREMLMDNGSAWGGPARTPTRLTVWLMRLFIQVTHGRPYHPQTQGKCERLNRTLQAEVLSPGQRWCNSEAFQAAIDRFRRTYNHERPHESLQMEAPTRHYRPSPVAFPEGPLPPIEYLDGDIVRRVQPSGAISLGSTHYNVGRGFAGEPVALRPTVHDGVYDVYYCHSFIQRLDVRENGFVKYQAKQSPRPRYEED